MCELVLCCYCLVTKGWSRDFGPFTLCDPSFNSLGVYPEVGLLGHMVTDFFSFFGCAMRYLELPQPGMEPMPPLQWKHRVLTAGWPGKPGHMVILCLIFWGTSILFSSVVAPFHSSMNSTQDFLISLHFQQHLLFSVVVVFFFFWYGFFF